MGNQRKRRLHLHSLAVIGALMLAGVASPAFAHQRPRGAGQPDRADVEYAKPGGVSLRLDLYNPRSKPESPGPAVVWIHGGAWRQGDKRNCPARFLTEHGFLVASINYRLSDAARYPAQILDVKAAIVWLKQHAEELHISPERIGVWGASAGGHLASLAGTSAGVVGLTPQAERDAPVDSRVAAVCDFFGPTDFLQMDAHAPPDAPFRHDDPQSPESQLIGGPIQQNPELVKLANPMTYVTRDDPPFLIMHGDQDRLVPVHQSKILHAKLEQAGVASDLKVIPGAGHGLRGKQIDSQVLAFFQKQLQSPSVEKQDPDPGPRFNPRTVIKRAFRPIVDAPAVPASEAEKLVQDNELVLGVVVGEASRAYPINLLCGPMREIINDKLGGQAIAATW